MTRETESPKALEVMIKHNITEQDIDDLFSTALLDGINYWAPAFRIKTHGENEQKKEFLSERLAETVIRGGVIEIAEDEEETGDPDSYKWHELDLAKLKVGFEKYFSDWHGPSTDSGDWDCEHADVIFQFAILGSIVYN